MISLEAILSFSAYLAVILLLAFSFSFVADKVHEKSTYFDLISVTEQCAFVADFLYSSTAKGELDFSFSCYANNGQIVSLDGNLNAYSETVVAQITSSTDNGSIKIIPKNHYY